MKKKSSRIFFVLAMLLLFLFGNFGSFILFHFSEELNREQILRLLKTADDKELTKLVVSSAELHDKNIYQEQEEDEIVYKGHLYDVAKKDVQPDGIVFYCINDREEEMLNDQLNEQVKTLFDHTPGSKTSSKSPSNKALRDYVTIAPVNFHSLDKGISFPFREHNTSMYGDVYSDIFSPPPSLA